MQPEIAMHPVGRVGGGRVQPEDDSWGAEVAVIELDSRFAPEALARLNGFSHIEAIFHRDRACEADISLRARHPRDRADWPAVSIFARRGKVRPNRIGVLSVVGLKLKVLGAVGGTPWTSKPW